MEFSVQCRYMHLHVWLCELKKKKSAMGIDAVVCAFICVCVHVMQWFVHSCMCVCVCARCSGLCIHVCVCV